MKHTGPAKFSKLKVNLTLFKNKIHYPLNQFLPSTFWLYHYVNVKREDSKSSIILYVSSGTCANIRVSCFQSTSSQCCGIVILY